MKKISLAIVVMATLVTTSALAQNRVTVRANVPFSFQAHDKTFAAGTYEVRQIGASLLRVQNKETGEGVTIITAPATEGAADGRLVFRQYGAQRFLSAIVAPAGGYGAELSTTSLERELAKNNGKAQIVAINLH